MSAKIVSSLLNPEVCMPPRPGSGTAVESEHLLSLVLVREPRVERRGLDFSGRFDHLRHFAAKKQHNSCWKSFILKSCLTVENKC